MAAQAVHDQQAGTCIYARKVGDMLRRGNQSFPSLPFSPEAQSTLHDLIFQNLQEYLTSNTPHCVKPLHSCNVWGDSVRWTDTRIACGKNTPIFVKFQGFQGKWIIKQSNLWPCTKIFRLEHTTRLEWWVQLASVAVNIRLQMWWYAVERRFVILLASL